MAVHAYDRRLPNLEHTFFLGCLKKQVKKIIGEIVMPPVDLGVQKKNKKDQPCNNYQYGHSVRL